MNSFRLASFQRPLTALNCSFRWAGVAYVVGLDLGTEVAGSEPDSQISSYRVLAGLVSSSGKRPPLVGAAAGRACQLGCLSTSIQGPSLNDPHVASKTRR
ncbi:hypothetical protein AVEN_99413-1 [Araneus ventricosus]|uniref:Uncharacterized protein n=1 Tax=Araneus ventricosus TaxID=182803 RepID=A0A4Y2UHH1_ARAVE|nr:hypothetical protein AVEN_99413-1 [Araneus ventricosus]